jgi:arylsulfatase A-like enzyme
LLGDQHRADCLGCYGNRDIRTPALDRLASDGTVYEESYCASPLCTPSRYSLLTGMYPHQHMGWSNRSTIPPAFDTFATILKKEGYRTAAVGKMHLTPTYQDIGFDEMLLAEQNGEGRFEDDYHRELKERGLIDRVDLTDQVQEYRKQADDEYWANFGAFVSDLPEEHHSTSWIGRHALDELEKWSADRPNLLMVSFIKPHHPFDPPRPWDRMYDPEKLTLLPGWTEECLPDDLRMHPGFFPHERLTAKKLREIMAYYYATISHIDHWIGRMIELLKSRGLYDDTLIVYTSDHGEYLGFHHLLLKQNYMYDPLVKVPLIIKWPDRPGGIRSDRLISNVDLAVTLIRQGGGEPAPYMAGMDIGNPESIRTHVFCEELRGRQYMVRTREHKLIWCAEESLSRLFDLSRDPLEMNNLFGDPSYAAECERLQRALSDMVLFRCPAPVHLDESARVLDKGRSHASERETVKQWIRSQMSG